MAKGYNKNQGSRFSDGIVSEGHITLNGSLWIPDTAVDTGPNDEDPGYINLGDGNDMNIHVSGSTHGVVRQLNTAGNLYLQSAKIDGGEVRITKNGAQETLAVFKNGPDVQDQPAGQNYLAGCFLYHNNSVKFSTRSYGAEITGTAKVEDAQIVGQPFVDNAKLIVAEIEFSEGSNTNDGAAIRFVSTSTNDNKSALDIRIDDDCSDTVSAADKIRFRMDPSPIDINGGAEYSLVEISAKRNGSTRMDLTTLVMDAGETRTSEVIADKFTGEASTVAALNNAAGNLTTDNLAEGTTNKYHTNTRARAAVEVGTDAAAAGNGGLGYDNSTGIFTYTPVGLASTSTAGIASFATADFSVSADGAVSLNDLKNGDIASDAAISYSKLATVAANSFVGNNTNAAAAAIAMTAAQARAVLGNIANGADNYDGWNINHTAADGNDGTATKIGSGGDVKFVGSGATTVSRSSGTVTITSANDDTQYTAGSDYGMTISTYEFRMKNDRRRQHDAVTVKTGNKKEYVTFNHDMNGDGAGSGGAIQFFTDGAEEMRLDSTGNLHVDQDIIGYSSTPSDERLKENIQVVDNALDKVSQLKGVTFDWERTEEPSAGLIAQDLEKVLPSAVKEKPLALHYNDEVYKTVEYSQVTALLVEAIKELKEQNDQLKADIEELKSNK